MFTPRATIATLGVTALLAAPLTTLGASPAGAVERGGRCDGARFDLEVERDDGRFEVDADIDNATPGSRWRITLKQDGRTYVNVVRTATRDDDDRDGDISIERNRPNTAGADTFRMTVNRIGTTGSCSRVITVR